MKKKMIIAILVVLVAFIGFGFYKASTLQSIQIVKKVTINAPQQKVFDMVRYLKNFPKWSPFLAKDPTQQYEVKGTDGMAGAQYHWNGNKGKDVGFQEIVIVDTFNHIGMMCDIQKPFKAKPTFDYYFTTTTNSVEVQQEFKLQSGIIDAFFMWLFGAKKEMEKTNEEGLALLKKAAESN
jgi:hypothetical protein